MKFLIILSLVLTVLPVQAESRVQDTSAEPAAPTAIVTPAVKKFRFGGFLDLGIEIVNTDDQELGDYSGARVAVGPLAYLMLNDKWLLRARAGYKKMNLNSDFGFVLLDFKEFEVDNSYLTLSFGGQIQFTRRFAMSLDYSANFDAGSFSCEDISFSPIPADEKAYCDLFENDLNSFVHYLKLGLSFQTAKWLFLEPYIEVSLNKLGDEYFKNSTSTGLNLAFAF